MHERSRPLPDMNIHTGPALAFEHWYSSLRWFPGGLALPASYPGLLTPQTSADVS